MLLPKPLKKTTQPSDLQWHHAFSWKRKKYDIQSHVTYKRQLNILRVYLKVNQNMQPIRWRLIFKYRDSKTIVKAIFQMVSIKITEYK